LSNIDIEKYTSGCDQKAVAAEVAASKLGAPKVIVWSSSDERASIYLTGKDGHEVVPSGSPRWKSLMLTRINSRLDQLTQTGAKVILLLQPKFADIPGSTVPPANNGFSYLNSLLQSAARNHPGHVEVADLASLVCPSRRECPYEVDGIIPRPDGIHFGAQGSLWVARWLVPKIASDT
jgi:hypothetical protein